ncbi:MAG: hypothetical protein WCJ30_11815, partial [Deltaproteobacteria bacterium]
MNTDSARENGAGAGAGGESPTASRSPVVAALVLTSLALHGVFLVARSATIAKGCAVAAAVTAVVSALLREPRALHATLLVALLAGWIASDAPLAWPLYLAV